MIISRAPFRITLAGGGTDLPAFYSKYGGSVTSMAIDKYIYVSFKKNLLDTKVRLQYLRTEYVNKVDELTHDRAKAALKYFGILNNCEISSMADLPSRSGLGSSGSYLVALINGLQEEQRKSFTKAEIAELACKIEITDLGEPVGKQDQYIASYGGIQTFDIDRGGKVRAKALTPSMEALEPFTERCRIYYTGVQRDASAVLRSQTRDQQNFEDKMLRIQALSAPLLEALKSQDYDTYGQLLHRHWSFKKQLSPRMTATIVDEIYNDLKTDRSILGGKIIGAGGGGFLMVYVPKEFNKVDTHMEQAGFIKINYALNTTGVQTIYNGDSYDNKS
jgi:D-glycero-alpha-D-manno-heptose-7-phosphate kinase